jgi:hypothetical protein
MYVFLNGYDQKGNIFVGTGYFGPEDGELVHMYFMTFYFQG